MKEMKYVPQGTAEKPSPFIGHVLLKIPRYRERLAMIKGAGYKTGEDGVGVSDGIDMMDKLLEGVETHVIGVHLTHKKTSLKFESLEDLECYQEGTELINELGQVLLSGVKLGEI